VLTAYREIDTWLGTGYCEGPSQFCINKCNFDTATWTDYKTNTQITKELKITQILNKLLEYTRTWIQHVNRMPRNRLPRVMKHYSPTGGRNHGRTLKRLLDTRDRNGLTSGPTP
jgi:hypothetical protein